jgi:hypothetical protein
MMRTLAICAALVLAQGVMAQAGSPPACDTGPNPPCLIALAEAELTAATPPENELPALRMMVRLFARSAMVSEAETMLDRITSDILRELAQAELALALAQAGHADAAMDAVQSIPSDTRRIATLIDIGRLGRPDLAPDRILARVAEILAAMPAGIARDRAVVAEAEAWAHLGRLGDARARMQDIEVDFNKARLRMTLAEVEGIAGDPVAAMAAISDIEGFDLAEVVIAMLARRADDAVLAALEIELTRIDDPVLALQYRLRAAHLLQRAGRTDAAQVWLDSTRAVIEANLPGPDADIYRVAFAEVALRLGRVEDARAITAAVSDPYVRQVAQALYAAHTLSPPQALDSIRALSDAQARLDGLVTLAGQSILD